MRPMGRAAFTLIEVLVTASLMALAGGAAVAALAGGVRVWERAADIGIHQQASLIALSRIRRDLQNARRFAPLPFDGSYDTFTFASAERDDPLLEAPAEIGQLGYYLESRGRILCRSFIPYRLLRSARLTDRCQPILEGVQRLRFDYFGSEAEDGEAHWTERWESRKPPLAVKLTMLGRGRDPQAASQSFVVFLTTASTEDEDAS